MLIKKGYIIITCMILAGCATVRTPRGYVPRWNEAGQNEYGSWIALIHFEDKARQQKSAHGGELIAIQDSILFLLDLDSLKQFPVKDIASATLVTHRFGGPQYFGWAALAFTPNFIGMAVHSDWALEFASLGMFQLLPAVIATLINSASVNEIKYPNRVLDLESLRIYARFPQGIPPGLDPYQLASKPPPGLP